MPIGIITEEEFAQEFSRVVLQELPAKGRNGKKEVPEEVRKLAAQELISGAPLKEIQEAFNISQASASAYKNGATSTSTYDKKDENLSKANDAFREKIKSLASDKLISAIESITQEKLEHARANVASAIARDMSQVMKNMTPEENSIQHNQVIIYKPRMKDEDDYEVIDVQRIEA